MSERITIHMKPLPYYNKFAATNYVLCGIDFDIHCHGTNYHFRSEISNICIKELLTEIENYLSGTLTPDTELFYYVPWIMGNHCVYPYSFKINSSDTWSFRYSQNDTESDFECEISKDDVISMQHQIKEQYEKMDWDSLGKTPIYTFDFPEKEYKWCYSAKAFCAALNDLCIGKSIKTMYVSAMNYTNPLCVEENYVNYYLGSKLIIQVGDQLLDLLIFAVGLFQWRVFDKTEYTLTGPALKFIEDGDEEFCDIGNVYNMFKSDYTNTSIQQVCVNETDCWPWSAKGFDESKLGEPIELPETILFQFVNNYTLSLHGLEDDFAIKLSSSNP